MVASNAAEKMYHEQSGDDGTSDLAHSPSPDARAASIDSGAEIHRLSEIPERLDPDVVMRRDQVSHPLISQVVPLRTPPVARLYSCIEQAILTGLSGCYVTGAHNDGISAAIRYCQLMIPKRMPGIAVFYHNFSALHFGHTHNRIAAFARSCGINTHGIKLGAIPNRTKQGVIVKTRGAALRTALIMLDNVQYMHADDIALLYDLRHELVANGLAYLCIAGSFDGELEGVAANVTAIQHHRSLKTAIIERNLGFTCVGTYEDLKSLMSLIDRAKDSTQKTYTSHFLPRAVRKGYLFENEAEMLFTMLDRHEGWAQTGFPAKALFACIRCYLTMAKQYDDSRSAPEGLGRELWSKALDFSCFVEVMDQKIADGVKNGYIPE